MFILSSRAHVLELPEPLWVRFLPINVWLGAAWRISGFARLRNRKARTYAIENNDPAVVIFGSRAPLKVVKNVGLLAVGLLFRSLYEKVAFGTDGAATAYLQLPGSRRVRSTVIPAVPAENPAARLITATPGSVVFVGHLDQRKGVEALIESWTVIEKSTPKATLTVIGDGPLKNLMADWAERAPTSRLFLGRLAHADAIHVVERASVLVAPSRRHGRWREQVGLPITEGLAAGLTVVTSSETGLAEWLAAHGHYVFDWSTEGSFTDALERAISSPLNRAAVLDSLPQRHGRLEADRWIHNG